MKLSIRHSALLMILAPTLAAALAVGAYVTRQRVVDARAELEARGVRESGYLANASELALLVGDSETLQRLAASNQKSPGSALAIVFLDAGGRMLAASGSAWEVGLALQCARQAADCSEGEQRFLFQRTVHTSAGGDDGGAFGHAPDGTPAQGEALGSVVLSFDPHGLESIQRGMLLNGLGITLAVALLALGLAQLFARRLIVPMQQLSSVVMRIRAGELDARTVPGGTGELRELEEGVNAMADRVQAASAELNRRVDEALAETSRTMLDLEQRNLELDLARERAEAASRAKDLFLARMSHELRTPLTTVTGYARMMQQSESPEQRADFGRSIEQASRILISTVDDILDFVKFESDSLHLEERDFELDTCIEDAVMMLGPVALPRGIDLVCHIDADVPPRVRGDSVRISQVLSNLVSNAVKFTQRGSVVVRARCLARGEGRARVGIEVIDTGIGIEEDSISQLFKPFAQADESITRRFGGSGLGLAITAHIVRALDGSIALSSRPGAGTRVSVELPLRESAADAAELPERLDAVVAIVVAAGSPHREVLADYLGRAFARVLVADPAAALAAGESPDLVVLVERAGENVEPPAFAAALPVVRVRPIEILTGGGEQYLDHVLPLPVRRRELLSACRRRLQAGMQVREPAQVPAGTRARLALDCLVVEDNELNRRMIATRLRDTGAEVCEAAGGAEALAALAARPFDVVLLDVHMPEMDGIELARRIRAGWPALPVYALTANVVGSEESALRAAGVRAVLYKPLDEERLLALLRAHEPGAAIAFALQPRAGIGAAEIEAEFRRLLAAVEAALGRGEAAAAAEAAHQLLGAARMFSQGTLADACLVLENALRAGDGAVATQLPRLRAALAGTPAR